MHRRFNTSRISHSLFLNLYSRNFDNLLRSCRLSNHGEGMENWKIKIFSTRGIRWNLVRRRGLMKESCIWVLPVRAKMTCERKWRYVEELLGIACSGCSPATLGALIAGGAAPFDVVLVALTSEDGRGKRTRSRRAP